MSIKNQATDRAPSPVPITIPQREQHPLNARFRSSAESSIQRNVRLLSLSSCDSNERPGNVLGDPPTRRSPRVNVSCSENGRRHDSEERPRNGQQTKRSTCSRTAVGAHGRLARFHDASPGAGRPPGPTGPRLLSQHSTRGYDRGSAKLSRSSASPLTAATPPGNLAVFPFLFWLSLLSTSSVSLALPTWPAPAGYPTQPPSLLHPLPRLPPSVGLLFPSGCRSLSLTLIAYIVEMYLVYVAYRQE